MKRAISMLAVFALVLGGPGRAKTATIVNGGFETGDFTGWTVSASFTSVETAGFDGFNPNSGNYFAALGNIGKFGSLSQVIATTNGQGYTLSMYMASDGRAPNEFAVYWNTSLLFDQVNIPAQAYQLLSFNVVGTGSDTLTILEQNDPAYLALDDVAINGTAPEPASMTLLGIGIAGMAGYGWRRRKQASNV
jgi:PEP-CTERM motif